MSCLYIESNKVLMWVGEAEWVPTWIRGRWKAMEGRTHGKSWAHTQNNFSWVCGWIGNLIRLRIFIKYRKQPREWIFIIWEIVICELWELVDDLFSCLSQFQGWKIPIQVCFWRGHLGISWRFNGFLFVGVGYRESHVSFYCNTFSQPFPVFMAYSCSWRDYALGELMYSLGEIFLIYLWL